MQTSEFQFFNRPEYFTQLAQLVSKAGHGDRVAVASMTFDPRAPLVANLMQELCAAAKRGAAVYLSIDAYTFLTLENSSLPGPLWFHESLPTKLAEPFQTWRNFLKELETSGGHYAITNIPDRRMSNPFAGRSHIKAGIVNDYIFIGGCNLQNPEHADIMVGQHNGKSAAWVYDWLVKMVATGSTTETYEGRDRYLRLSDSMELFVDTGKPKQSIIYDHAIQLIDEAREHIYFTCQYFPGGKTAQHLLTAFKRGVDVRIVYAHPGSHGIKSLGHYIYNKRERLRMPEEFFAEERSKDAPYLHAKIIATEQGAMVGSHNYVTQGVNFGTAEIALLNRDPEFSQKLIQKIGSGL